MGMTYRGGERVHLAARLTDRRGGREQRRARGEYERDGALHLDHGHEREELDDCGRGGGAQPAQRRRERQDRPGARALVGVGVRDGGGPRLERDGLRRRGQRVLCDGVAPLWE